MDAKEQIYKFDAIITKTDLPPPREDDTTSDYSFSVRIFKDFVDLTFNRMWTEDFPIEHLGEIKSSPCDLIGLLTSKGVCVTLYKKQLLMGSGTTTLTPLVLRQLTDPTFEVVQTVDMEIQNQGQKVDTIQMKLKFSSQHPDIDPERYCIYDVCRTADSSLHPKDLIFTLGRSCKSPGTACITDNRLMSHVNAPFQCVHATNTPKDVWNCCLTGGEVPPPPPPEQDKRSERNILNDLLKELDVDRERIPTPPASHAAGRKWQCQCKRMKDDSDSDMDDCSKESFHLSGGHVDGQEDDRRRALGFCPIEEPKLTQTIYQISSQCPVCHSDVSWLPNTAACPYCGYKNYTAIITENHEEEYDESATAQQILNDFRGKDKCLIGREGEVHSSGDTNTNDPQRCGCISGRACTRCRIRKACENLFREQNTEKSSVGVSEEQNVKQSPIKAPKMLVKKDSTASQRRSHLVQIFNEMRNAYDTKKKKSSQVDLLNEQLRNELEIQCSKSKKSRQRRALEKTLKEINKSCPSPLKKRKTKISKQNLQLDSKRYSFIKVQKSDQFKRIGHEACISDGSYSGYCKIPCYMGWNWPKSEMSRFKSWKPGAISKPIKVLMSYYLKDFPVDSICVSRYNNCTRKPTKIKDNSEEEPLVQHPTLHISKKHDEYIITLRPLKDAKSLPVCPNPYADMKPIVFRITKDPFAVKVREIRNGLKDKGFAPCTCNNPVSSCFCRSMVDKQRLVYTLDVICAEMKLPGMSDTFIFTEDDDDDSEQEYEFGVTPPAGLIKPELSWHPDHVHVETQYMDDDWAMPSMFPHPANALTQYGGCVMGERKGKFQWIYGKGKVHSIPRKPAQRNIIKNKNRGKKRLKGGEDTSGVFVRSPTHGTNMWHKSSSPEMTSMIDVRY